MPVLLHIRPIDVTSYAEVGIEILVIFLNKLNHLVTSYAEVGIEIEVKPIILASTLRHLLRGGGD